MSTVLAHTSPSSPREDALSLGRLLGRRLLPAAVLIGVSLSVLAPVTYYFLRLGAMRQTAALHAYTLATRVGELVLESHGGDDTTARREGRGVLWRYQVKALEGSLGDFSAPRDIIRVRILDTAGVLVGSYQEPSATGWISRHAVGRAPLFFNNLQRGTVEIELSQGRLPVESLMLLAGSTVLGTVLALFVYFYPVGIVRRAERRIARLVDALEQRAAEHATLAAETRRLYDESQRHQRRLQALVDVTHRLTRGLDRDDLLRHVGEAAAVVFEGEAGFRVVDGDVLVRVGATPLAAALMPIERIPIRDSVVGRVALTGQPFVTADIRGEATLNKARGYRGRDDVGALMCVPVQAGERILGTLSVFRELHYAFDDQAVAIATSLASQTAIALQNAELHAGSLRRGEQLGALLGSVQTIMADLDLGAMLERLLGEAARMAGKGDVNILLADGEAGVLRVAAGTKDGIPRDCEIPIGDRCYSARVLATRRPLFVDDPESDPANCLHAHGTVGVRTYLGLPIHAADEAFGVLVITTREPRQYVSEDLEYLQSFADHAALAIQHARLYAAAQKRVVRLRALTRLNQLVSSSLDTDEVLREINLAAAQLVDAPIASFWLADETRQTLDVIAFSDPVAGESFPTRRLRFDQGAVGWSATHRRTLNVADIFGDPRFVALDWCRAQGLTSFAAIPVVLDGALLAVLAFNGRTPFRFDAEEEDLLGSFTAQIGLAIRNARLFARSEARRREAEALAEVGRVVSQTLDPEVVAQRVVDTVASLLHARISVLYLTDPGTGQLVVRALTAGRPTSLRTGMVIPPGTGVTGRVVIDRAPLVTGDVFDDPRVTLQPWQRANYEFSGDRSVLAVPLIVQDRVIGALTLSDEPGRVFDADEVRVAQTFADQAGLALESARLYRDAERMVDELHAKNAELDSFVHSVSHDLRGPLVAIQGMATTIVEDYADRLDEDGRHYLDRLSANVAKMEALIRDLLALSRAGRNATPPAMVDLDDLVAQIAAELADTIRAREITIVHDPLGTLWGAPAQIEQVLRNLVGNAVKYSRPTNGRIEIGRLDRDDHVECWVKDDGIGIDAAYHEKVFEIFQRLKEIEVEGSGVGLAIVRKVVTGVGGRVWVESARGEGATFRFTWPAASLAPSESPAAAV